MEWQQLRTTRPCCRAQTPRPCFLTAQVRARSKKFSIPCLFFKARPRVYLFAEICPPDIYSVSLIQVSNIEFSRLSHLQAPQTSPHRRPSAPQAAANALSCPPSPSPQTRTSTRTHGGASATDALCSSSAASRSAPSSTAAAAMRCVSIRYCLVYYRLSKVYTHYLSYLISLISHNMFMY